MVACTPLVHMALNEDAHGKDFFRGDVVPVDVQTAVVSKVNPTRGVGGLQPSKSCLSVVTFPVPLLVFFWDPSAFPGIES